MTVTFTLNFTSIFSGTLTVNLPAGAITDQFGNGNQAFTGNYEYVGTAPKGCGLPVGSGMTLGFEPNGWNATLASNTVQYTFATGQPAAAPDVGGTKSAGPPREARSVSLDFETGIKTTLFSDGTTSKERFEIEALKGLATPSTDSAAPSKPPQ